MAESVQYEQEQPVIKIASNERQGKHGQSNTWLGFVYAILTFTFYLTSTDLFKKRSVLVKGGFGTRVSSNINPLSHS